MKERGLGLKKEEIYPPHTHILIPDFKYSLVTISEFKRFLFES